MRVTTILFFLIAAGVVFSLGMSIYSGVTQRSAPSPQNTAPIPVPAEVK